MAAGRKVFLFDIDGTLLMAGGAGRAAFVAAWTDVFGTAQPFSHIDFSGRTDTSVFAEGFALSFGRTPDPQEENAFFESYHRHLTETVAVSEGFRVLPGVRNVLQGLSAGGDCIIGLVTGNTRQGAFTKLKKAGLDQYFAFGGFGSDSPLREKLTAVAIERARAAADGCEIEVTVTGDSVFDAYAARANHARLVLVATGKTPFDRLAAENPDVMFDSFSDWERTLAVLRGTGDGLRVDIDDPACIERASAVVRAGGTILYPTATLYGIGGNGFDADVATRIRNIKRRTDTSFILLAADMKSALAIGTGIPEKAVELAQRFWPGPLTLIFPAAENVPEAVRGPQNTVAVRVDAHPFTRELAAAAGCPVISTSANISGQPPASRHDEMDDALVAACDLFVVDGHPGGGLPSTLVAFRDGTPVVLRQGAIPGDML